LADRTISTSTTCELRNLCKHTPGPAYAIRPLLSFGFTLFCYIFENVGDKAVGVIGMGRVEFRIQFESQAAATLGLIHSVIAKEEPHLADSRGSKKAQPPTLSLVRRYFGSNNAIIPGG